ncbi:AAA family ATPase, partial [Blautia marasmi]|uniref:AAA family ATPase n=1 Tax=Blautia marasmi TaxID=1917868 RepID=UPI00266CAF09
TRNNFELSKKIFGLLDDDIKFNTVNPRTGDIILSSSKGDVYFEYMSSGYKTCFYILLGLIKEIEYRFGDSIFASDFSGIILIDEIDLHLHPLWQAKLINVLKNIFGNAQIIATTHSPSILQSLNKDEIIALGYDECGKAIVKELNLGEYGLQGWTLEEILQDVMEMPYTTSELYKRTISKFDKAMDDGNISEIKHNYEILDKMLHPRSTLRKLLQIQMAGLEE